jgi:uncharacterized protein (TIGR02266 family)
MRRKKILLSDNPELLQALENSFFRRIGFSLEVADSGERAFEIIEEQDPLLAILSLEMPDWQGDAICRRVKRDAILRSTPIILVVPDGSEKAIACCREAGCDDILSLPIDSQQLLATACRLLNIVERGASRSENHFPVLYGKDPKKLRPARVLNLNAGGLFIESDRLHPVNTRLTLEFTLPEQTAMIRAIGRVAWVNHPEWIKTSRLPSGMGIQFLELTDADAAAVSEYALKESLDSQ